jgi:hypothetical protein
MVEQWLSAAVVPLAAALAVRGPMPASGATHVALDTVEAGLQLGRAALLGASLAEDVVDQSAAPLRQHDCAILSRIGDHADAG